MRRRELALGPDAAGRHDSNAAVEVADEARSSCRVRHESPCDVLAHALQPVQNLPNVSLNSNVPESPYNSSQKFRPAAPAKGGAAGEEQRGLVETRLR